MKKIILISCLIIPFLLVLTQCSQNVHVKESETAATTVDSTISNMMSDQTQIHLGRHLVAICVCDDCHSPKIMTPQGPIVDSTKRLCGHPADISLIAFSYF
jgi:hypothetical protein